MKLIKQLQWRYSVKRMNGAEVPKEKVNKILESVRLAPTSMGLQPFEILVVDNPEVKKDLFQIACGQPQVLESSHLLIFSAWNQVTELLVDDYMRTIAEIRDLDIELLDDFKKSILKFVSSKNNEEIREWAARQVYIALGTAIDAAALCHVDATPMEGFNSKAIDEYFDLKEDNLHSVVLLALGYRDVHKDEFAEAPKVRRHFDDLFRFI